MPDNDETPSQRARRKWRNNHVRQKYKELDKVNRELAAQKVEEQKVLHTNTEAQLAPSEITKLHDRFRKRLVKEIKSLFDDRAAQNLINYQLALDAQMRALLREKLRRLELQQKEREQQEQHGG
jgi:hypothetical protein